MNASLRLNFVIALSLICTISARPGTGAETKPPAQLPAQPASQPPSQPTALPAKSVASPSPTPKGASTAGPFTNHHYVLTKTIGMNGYHAEDPTLVIVDKGSHSTIVLQLQDNAIVRVLTISNAVGNTKKPTPPGRYTVVAKKLDPKWVPPKTIKHKPVRPYSQTHENPLGVAAIFLDRYDIDLHGTNDQKDIRKSISHGCVRHSNPDIMRLYNMVERGDTVYIIRQFRGTVLNQSDFKPRHKKEASAPN